MLRISAICTPYPLGYVVVLIRSRSPTTIVVPPVPTNCAWFVLHEPDVRAEKAVGPSAVRFADVIIVSLTADVVSPVGVDVINSVQFVPSPDLPMLTPITRGSVVHVIPEMIAPLLVKRLNLIIVD